MASRTGFHLLTLALLTPLVGCPSEKPDLDPEEVQDWDGDGFGFREDCDDRDPDSFPGAEDIPCDGIDQDCENGDAWEEEVPYDGIDQDCEGGDLIDVDRDGFSALVVGGEDCDDNNIDVNPEELEVPYDGIDQDCDGEDVVDVDGDGYVATEAGGEDCDDNDEFIHPGQFDDCFAGDADCDGEEDEDEDIDADGFTICELDCDDNDASVHPDATEVAEDGIDQDCDGDDLGNCSPQLLGPSDLSVNVTLNQCSGGGAGGIQAVKFDYEIPQDADCDASINYIEWFDSVTFSTDIGSMSINGRFWGTYFSGGNLVDDGRFDGWGNDLFQGSCSNGFGSVEVN